MGEPGFYICKKCSRRWQRWEAKMSANPPAECPGCGSRDQATDRTRDEQYTREFYGAVADVLFGGVKKDGE